MIYHVLILLLFCIEYIYHYKNITHSNKNLTKKQKSNILSIKNSLTLSIYGIYYIINISNSEKETSLFISKLIVLYFTAYLISDIYIGYNEYNKYMLSLSGYTHHIVYIIINILTLYFEVYPIYLLFMILEIPTFILTLGSFNKNYRDDILFGITFLLTRIIYHILILVIFNKNKIIYYVGCCALIMHIYWFYNWIKKYGNKLFIN